MLHTRHKESATSPSETNLHELRADLDRAVPASSLQQGQCRLNSEQDCTSFGQRPSRQRFGL